MEVSTPCLGSNRDDESRPTRAIMLELIRPRFKLRTFLLLVAIAAAGCWWWENTHPHGLQRTSKGLQRFANYTFRFDRTQLHISNDAGTVSMPYKTSKI